MAAFFGNLRNVVIAGFVLAAGLAAIYVGCLHGSIDAVFWAFVTRWLHVAAGVMWIGLLWYFNFVQVPTMPKVPAELKGGVTGYIAPAALFYFRWAALVTVILGLGLASQSSSYTMGDALTLGLLGTPNAAASLIGIGMSLGLIMAFNVWFIIWPNQKIALGIVEAEADAKAKAARTAMLTSRINSVLSLAMLYCMVAQNIAGK